MASTSLRNVKKTYGKNAVVHGVDLEIESGEFIVILGPSGCGKSTLQHTKDGDPRETGGQAPGVAILCLRSSSLSNLYAAARSSASKIYADEPILKPPTTKLETSMQDLTFLLLGGGAFVLFALYAHWLNRIGA